MAHVGQEDRFGLIGGFGLVVVAAFRSFLGPFPFVDFPAQFRGAGVERVFSNSHCAFLKLAPQLFKLFLHLVERLRQETDLVISFDNQMVGKITLGYLFGCLGHLDNGPGQGIGQTP